MFSLRAGEQRQGHEREAGQELDRAVGTERDAETAGPAGEEVHDHRAGDGEGRSEYSEVRRFHLSGKMTVAREARGDARPALRYRRDQCSPLTRVWASSNDVRYGVKFTCLLIA
jgi:hypothetical protein